MCCLKFYSVLPMQCRAHFSPPTEHEEWRNRSRSLLAAISSAPLQTSVQSCPAFPCVAVASQDPGEQRKGCHEVQNHAGKIPKAAEILCTLIKILRQLRQLFGIGLFTYKIGVDAACLSHTHILYSPACPTSFLSCLQQLYGLLSRDNLISSPNSVY